VKKYLQLIEVLKEVNSMN